MYSPILAGFAGLALISSASADFHLGNLFTVGTIVDYEYYQNVAVPSNKYFCGGTTNQFIKGKPANQDSHWPASFQSNGQICGISFDFRQRNGGGYDLYDVNGFNWGWCDPNDGGHGFSCFRGVFRISFTERFVCYTNACK